MSEIKRYDPERSHAIEECADGDYVKYSDYLSNHGLLEARCKELESALPREKLLKMKMACERLISPCTVNMAGRSVNMMSILDAQAVYHSIVDAPSILKLVEAALSTPTTDEHLQKLFVEWLGEPVAYMNPNAEDTLSMLHWSKNEYYSQPLYAPKKVSE